ncbi:MAG: sulfite exporter TauE/SafE family protein [Chloroflexota bacterium]
MIAGLDGPTLAYAVLAIFAGAFVRGYSGFGSSMIWVSSLTLAMPPTMVVPVVLALEVLASAHLLPKAWSAVDWRSVAPLVLAASAATPLGVWLLATIPARPMQAVIAAVVLVAAIVLWTGYTFMRVPGRTVTIATGLVSGVINGSTSAGGPPIVIFYFSTPIGMHATRASLIAYFLFIDAMGVGVAALSGLVSTESLLRIGLLLPPLLVGTALGSRQFLKTSPATFRRAALVLLMALGIAGVVRALVD